MTGYDGGGWPDWCTCAKATDGEHAAYQVEETSEEAGNEEVHLERAFVLGEANGAQDLKDERHDAPISNREISSCKHHLLVGIFDNNDE